MTSIKQKMREFGYTEKQATEIVKSLKAYVKNYGRRWKEEINYNWMRAYYPDLTDEQGGLMQRVRNSYDASNYVRRLTGPKIKAETI